MKKFQTRTLTNEDVYSKVTKKITHSLEKGVIPWKQPWSNAGLLPMNISSMKNYQGSNSMLGFAPTQHHFGEHSDRLKTLADTLKRVKNPLSSLMRKPDTKTKKPANICRKAKNHKPKFPAHTM